jgi:hypothetical protein
MLDSGESGLDDPIQQVSQGALARGSTEEPSLGLSSPGASATNSRLRCPPSLNLTTSTGSAIPPRLTAAASPEF